MLAKNYLTVKYVCLEGGKTWQPPSDGFFFFFLLEGAGDYSDEKVARQLRRGDVLVLKQDGNDTRFVAKPAGMAFKWFSLQPEQLYPLFDITELSLLEEIMDGFSTLKPFHASVAEVRECQSLVADLPLDPSLQQRVQVLAIAARILSKELEVTRTRRPGFQCAEEHMENVFRTLSEPDFLSLSVPELAKRFGCSRRHLNRLFHQFFGSSIADFRMELRLKKVACLLRNPSLKIISVAEQCGFNHLGHFNARFKRRFGASPAQWRKQLQETTRAHDNRGRSEQKGAGILKRWVSQQNEPDVDLPAAFDSSHGSAYSQQDASPREHANC